MKPAEIRDYLEREWELRRELKDRYWAERKRSLAPDAALAIGDGLREHARRLRPEWPDAAAREADLEVHARVSTLRLMASGVGGHLRGLMLLELPLAAHAWLVLLTLLSLVVGGYEISYATNNDALQLPLVHLLNDPSLYPDDPFAQTLPGYASLVWRLVAWGARLVDLETLLLGLFVAQRLLFVYASSYLARSFCPGSIVATLTAPALFALIPLPILGGGTILESHFEQTALFNACFLVAAGSFYRRQRWATAAWLGAGSAFNPMYGVYGVTYLMVAFLLDSPSRARWRHWLPAAGLFLLLSLPMLWMAIRSISAREADAGEWYAAASLRFPSHLLPGSWDGAAYRTALLLALLLVAFLWQERRASPWLRQAVGWTAVAAAWLGLAFVAAYAVRLPALLVLHPGRATDLWYCLAGVVLVAVAAERLDARPGSRRWLLLAVVFAATAALLVPAFRGESFAGYALLGTVLLLALPAAARYGGRRAVVAATILLLAGTVGGRAWREARGRWQPEAGLASAVVRRGPAEIAEIAAWARQHTPRDADFLVDPSDWNWAHFRHLAQRGVFTNWKDGSAILWHRAFVTPWMERLRAFGLPPLKVRELRRGLGHRRARKGLQGHYAELTYEEVAALHRRYGVDYWVALGSRRKGPRVVYRSEHYRVVLLGRRTQEGPLSGPPDSEGEVSAEGPDRPSHARLMAANPGSRLAEHR